MPIRWTGQREVIARMREYERRVQQAVRAVLEYMAAVIEAYAKANAPWTDQTGNARQALFTLVEDLSRDVVALYLSHGVEYGIWLELKNSGKYAVILPALEAHYDEIMKMLQGIFK
jgi:hypothetical protein